MCEKRMRRGEGYAVYAVYMVLTMYTTTSDE